MILVSFYVHQHPCSNFEFCHQKKETLIVFCVQQYQFPIFLPFPQEEGTCVASCVHRHHCIIFEVCSPVRETVVGFDVQQYF
jgi:hypothetical protein